MPPPVLAFDIYGTLVNVYAMSEHLRPFVGERAERFAELWREKQVEYSFRRALMRRYADFGVCTADALTFTANSLRITLTDLQRKEMLAQYGKLPAFPEARDGLLALRDAGHRLVAFSNGPEKNTRPLLENTGLLALFENVISVDDRQTFKPDPVTYHYLLTRLECAAEQTWMISSNPFDVLGARHAGLHAVWVQRSADRIFDPWNDEGLAPDFVVPDLRALAAGLRTHAAVG